MSADDPEPKQKGHFKKQTGHFLCDAVQQNQNHWVEGTADGLQNSFPVRVEEEELLFIRSLWVQPVLGSGSGPVSSVKSVRHDVERTTDFD